MAYDRLTGHTMYGKNDSSQLEVENGIYTGEGERGYEGIRHLWTKHELTVVNWKGIWKGDGMCYLIRMAIADIITHFDISICLISNGENKRCHA